MLALALAGAAGAHDLLIDVKLARPAVLLHASYGGSEGATDADVSIFAPDRPESPYQSGFTDLQGAFAFVASQQGTWRAVIDDGFGHRVEREIVVDWDLAESGAQRQGRSTLDKAILGVSLIFGAMGLWLWFQARTRLSGKSA